MHIDLIVILYKFIFFFVLDYSLKQQRYSIVGLISSFSHRDIFTFFFLHLLCQFYFQE